MNASIYFDLDDYSEASYLAVPEGIRKIINVSDRKSLMDQTVTETAPLVVPIEHQRTYPPLDPHEPQPDVALKEKDHVNTQTP